MIRPLRARHRGAIVLLAIALPPLVVAGLLARRPIPRMERLPDGLAGAAADASGLESARIASWAGGSLRAAWLPGAEGAPRPLSIELLQELERPDLLVFWSADPAAVAEGLPDDAELLGRLAGRHPVVLELPARASGGDGRLILYSPSQDEVVVSFRAPALAGPTDGGSR